MVVIVADRAPAISVSERIHLQPISHLPHEVRVAIRRGERDHCGELLVIYGTRHLLPNESPNAAVERRRDHVSSAPHVHNEMAHMRRARVGV
jgi:hypothetical protein